MHFSRLFSSIAYFKVCFEAHKIRLPLIFISCRSLLLSTSVLNDICTAPTYSYDAAFTETLANVM